MTPADATFMAAGADKLLPAPAVPSTGVREASWVVHSAAQAGMTAMASGGRGRGDHLPDRALIIARWPVRRHHQVIPAYPAPAAERRSASPFATSAASRHTYRKWHSLSTAGNNRLPAGFCISAGGFYCQLR